MRHRSIQRLPPRQADKSRPDRALAVYDGVNFLGIIIERDHQFYAFDARDRRVGTFQNQVDAVRALPAGGAR